MLWRDRWWRAHGNHYTTAILRSKEVVGLIWLFCRIKKNITLKVALHFFWVNISKLDPLTSFDLTNLKRSTYKEIKKYIHIDYLDRRVFAQCLSCLAGSSKTAPKILIFSIAMGAYYSFMWKQLRPIPAHFWHLMI